MPVDRDKEVGRLEDVRILVVDDDDDVREAMVVALESEGAQTLAVADGNEAVRVCHESQPDLVVLDMMLPKRSGFLVLEKIKGYENSPLVIMVTANEGKRHQVYAEMQGADRYLTKPVPLETLIQTAVELIAKSASADDADDE